ncbi:lysylphosphatidylglycerol synthase transmembrane domain-containing protein [Lacipirellula parvula]|uniref:Flippase-like domain-containing protein n=1 Tax=Lacipirellula parvula TaxID=2650471 RepID=A0A5K7XGB8_9BACT|nr:lysylphosphatidylglycerol synthase transmembrane domain-containing protein [Lacipirellula parvula]BBO33283.1 hypothetical protein PLANPX_2895 [Lacipirellula parvula]
MKHWTPARALQLTIAIGITIAFLYLAFRRVDPREFWSAVLQASPVLVAAACASCGAGLVVRVTRWWWMLRQTQPAVAWRNCFTPFMGCLALNNLLPFRAGDVVRVVAFRERLGVTSSTLLATLAVERVLDAFCLLALFASFLPYLSRSILPPAGQTALVVLAAATITCGLLALFALRPLRKLLGWIATLGIVERRPFAGKTLHYIDGVFASMQDVVGPRSLVALLFLSAAVWLFEGGIFFFVAWSLGITAPPVAAWIAMTLASLSTLIPSSPGYVGPYHYFAILGISTFGVADHHAAAFAVVSHAILYLMITLWGGGLLIAAGGSSRLRKASELSAGGDSPADEPIGDTTTQRSITVNG